MSMTYIRETYGLPVKRGIKVCHSPTGRYGHITSCTNYVRICWDDDPKHVFNYHPNDTDLSYLPSAKSAWLKRSPKGKRQ